MNPLRRLPDPKRRSFLPPFCPNPACLSHQPHPGWHAQRDGFFLRPSDHSRIQCFRCPRCQRRFSSQTFATTYWLRLPRLLVPCAALAVSGAGLRQIARFLNTSHPTVARSLSRCARHCLLFHQLLLHPFSFSEPLVVDGFESFEFSQFFPFHANLAVGARSWLLYYFTDSPLRRKGSMTPHQIRKRALLERTLGRPDPKAVELGMAALLSPLLPHVADDTLVLHSDNHPAYRRALRRLRQGHPLTPHIHHHITSGTARRTQRNPLFPVNLLDLLLRHSSANHRRETIAFSKRRQAALERLAVFLIWRNYIKPRREKDQRPAQTAAMVAGLSSVAWTWRRLFGRRLFPQHVQLPPEWLAYYWRQIKTLALGSHQTVHACRYAF